MLSVNMWLRRTASWGLLALGLVCGLTATAARAVEPGEVLADPALEARARELSAELRCVVCQNQSIDDSNAPLAKDLRVLVRERLVAGDSNADVKRFLVARYGEFVLLRPPLGWHTFALWFTPLIVLILTIGVIAQKLRRGRVAIPVAAAPLNADERTRLDRLLGSDDAGRAAVNRKPDRRA
jgi:cytochrome c-type biogenesis protein CcmH